MLNARTLKAKQRDDLLSILETRFAKHMNRHTGVSWADVHAKLSQHPEALWSISEMEDSGGEPDVVGYDKNADQFTFFDCVTESPKGRRSLCYDREA